MTHAPGRSCLHRPSRHQAPPSNPSPLQHSSLIPPSMCYMLSDMSSHLFIMRALTLALQLLPDRPDPLVLGSVALLQSTHSAASSSLACWCAYGEASPPGCLKRGRSSVQPPWSVCTAHVAHHAQRVMQAQRSAAGPHLVEALQVLRGRLHQLPLLLRLKPAQGEYRWQPEIKG